MVYFGAESPKMWEELPNHLKFLNSLKNLSKILKIGYHKTAHVDYPKIFSMKLVSFRKEIGKNIHIYLHSL